MTDENKKYSRSGLEIAVIGMALRFPGAKNIQEFWDNLKNGVESISFITDSEPEKAGIDSGWLKDANYVKSSGGVLENKEYFDAYFFEYSPREAKLMDPQIRIFHECVFEALEDAGVVPSKYGGLIGLYAGSENSLDWETRVFLSGLAYDFGSWATLQLSYKDYLATRVSHRLDLKGPAMIIQTACSTSLAAVHTASRALLTGDCHTALAGGVSVTYSPNLGYLYQEGRILSADGHCRAFDARAKGTVGGEGAGVIVLKPLQAAISEGDHIYAIIKGSAMNNDGINKVGFTASSVQGQAAVIKAAHRFARVESESIGYIETHGTGTVLGDPIEIEALSKAFNTKRKRFCAVGSVKTNVGHLGAAAGVAGFIKTVLALKNRLIPPSLHFETPNPAINFENSPFYVNTRLSEWENNNGYPLRAGVSSFGIGGTNIHAVLEEVPGGTREQAHPSNNQYHLILLSAKTPSSLERMTENLVNYFKENPGINMAEAVYTLQVGRDAFQYRKVLGCTNADEAVAALTSGDPTRVETFQVKFNEPSAVFMFPGQGSQYVDMGRDLYEKEPIFRDEMNRCFEISKPFLGYDVKEILYPTRVPDNSAVPLSSKIDQTEIAQPLLFIFEYSLARLLIHWGIEPYAMIGHSIGEYVAACLSGVFSLEDALKLVAARGHLMQQLPPGTMLGVSISEKELLPLLESHDQLSLAAVNSTTHCVVSGPNQAVNDIENHLKKKEYSTRLLHTSHAFHSNMMEPILKEFEKRAVEVNFHEPKIPYISNVTGQWIRAEESGTPTYWAGHLRATVLFSSGLTELLKKKDTIFIEVGPGRSLSTFVKLHENKKPGQEVINLIRHPQENIADTYYLLNKLGHLWGHGKSIDWQLFYREEKRQRISLPPYPFEHQKFWIDGDYQKIFNQGPGGFKVQIPGHDSSDQQPLDYQRPELKSEYAAPDDNIEKELANIWQNFFGIERIGIYDDLLELGADSLLFATAAAKIQKTLDARIPITVFFNKPNIKELAEYARNTKKERYYFIKSAEKKEYYRLSSPQRRLYVLSQLDKESAAYNIPTILKLEGEIDKNRLENSFKWLIKRHESLRTSFEMFREEPVQKIHDDMELSFEYYDLVREGTGKTQEERSIVERFIRPFDLSCAPLLRAGLIKITNQNHILMTDIHHIVSDGTSINVFLKDFITLYQGETIPGLRIQYKDFSVWQNSKKTGELIKEWEEYWLNEFADEIPVLNLPIDYKRPVFQSFEGSTIRFEISKEDTLALKKQGLAEEATLFMILLMVYSIFLSKISGQEDIIIGTPQAGRNHPDLGSLIGIFLNTLALRTYPQGKKTFREFLAEIKQKTLEAFENQEYHFEHLVEKLEIERDTSRNPIYSVLLVLLNFETLSGQEPQGLKVKRVEYERNGSTNDMTIYAGEIDDRLCFSWEYCTKLFKKETIERFFKYFKKIIYELINSPQKRISEIVVITDQEKQWLLFEINNTRKETITDKCYHQLFMETAGKYPFRQAARHNHEEISYGELDRQSNRIAHFLLKQGLQPNSIVGLYLERGINMLACIIGIFKAGSAYLPIETDYPVSRVQYILENSESPIIITNRKNENNIHSMQASLAHQPMVLCLDGEGNRENTLMTHDINDPGIPVNPENLSYLIFTSGTTGNPKGVMIQQKGMLNHMAAKIGYFSMTDKDVLPQTAHASFDISVWQFLTPVLLGGYALIIDVEIFFNPVKFLQTLQDEKVTLLEFVPSWLTAFLEVIQGEEKKQLPHLRWMVPTGDVLPVSLVREWYALYPGIKMVNVYGPTEASDDISHYTIDDIPPADLETIPVGKPLDNLHIYVLDRYLHLCPVGVRGEICVSGIGVGKGYWKDPQKTAESFIPNPYREEIGHMDYSLMYKTGDIGYIREDGHIVCLGRKDQQVKIRGNRLELGEIESQLLSCDMVKETVVTVNQGPKGEKHLCAYVVLTGNDCSIQAIRGYLSARLPYYMIPSFFVTLDKIPLTPNGKLDKKALPIPEESTLQQENVEPRSEIERKIEVVWKEVLNRDDIGVFNDFFEMGGNSLDAISVVAQLSKDLDVTINHIFQLRTIAAIANNLAWKKDYFLSRIKNTVQNYYEIDKVNVYDEAHKMIKESEKEYLKRIKREGLPSLKEERDYRSILLSGGTGYLGAFLIFEIIENTSAVLHLVVRGNSFKEAEERLKRNLSFYFGEEFFEKNQERLRVVPMNKKKNKLGIDSSLYDRLSNEVEAVVHAAGNVSFFGNYEELYKDNVELTEAFLEFACNGRKKDFHHSSTIAISLGNVGNQPGILFTEFCHDEGQKFDNVYAKTKLEAERRVLLYQKKGLNTIIYRLGNLISHSETGKFQVNIEKNAVYIMIKAFIILDMIPYYEGADVDMSFIDYTAKAMVTLMKKKNLDNVVHHLYNPHRITCKGIIKLINKIGFNIKEASWAQFGDYLMKCIENNHHADILNRLFLDTGVFEDEFTRITHRHLAEERTVQLLKKAGFKWPRVNKNHMKKIIAYWREIGFIQ